MAALLISPPPSSGGLVSPHHMSNSSTLDNGNHLPPPPWKSRAVNRSNELLSCARTALKIGQLQHKQQQQQLQQGPLSSSSSSELPDWLVEINPAQLTLYQPPPSSYDEFSNNYHHHDHNSSDSPISLLSDSQSLLSLLDTNLSQLHSLVRRRGHTNDPTLQINSLMNKFQEAAQEMKQVCELLRLAGTLPPPQSTTTNSMNGSHYNKKSSVQRRKHYELVSAQLELLAKERTDRLKKELETRSQVLRDQTNRRKLLATGAAGDGAVAAGAGVATATAVGKSPVSAVTATTRLSHPNRLPCNPKSAPSQFQSPLFTATAGVGGSGVVGGVPSSSGYSGYAGYGGTTAANMTSSAGYGGTTRAGYGGEAASITSSAPSFATGIRQRKQQQQQEQSRIQIDHGASDDDKYSKDASSSPSSSVQQQIYERRQNRAAQSRLASARLAEKSIAELGVMFTKMSTLISQQGEVLERIEDDVEAAGADIDAGHDELVKVYGMTKGNRGLILKVFGILIFLILFMKLY